MENFTQWTVDGLNAFDTPWAKLFHFAGSLLVVGMLGIFAFWAIVSILVIINAIGTSRAQERRARELKARQAWLARKAQIDPDAALNRTPPDGLLERSPGYRFGRWVRNRRRVALRT
jgi:hypothetical protein